MISRSILHYRILNKLGVSEMSKVSAASDERPDRQMAKLSISHANPL